MTAYAPDCRKRHEHHRRRNEIFEFVVQLEILIHGQWRPVIRYDTAHGFAHCDILHPSGKKEKVRMPSIDYKEALTYADEDLSQNWHFYQQRYMKEIARD